MPIDAISPNRLSAAAFIIAAFGPEPSRPLAKMRMRSRRCRGVCKWVPHGATFKSCSDHRGKIQSGFRFGKLGRSERIRTSGPCLPKAVLYQAELHSDAMRVTPSTLASHVVGTDAGAEAADESNQRWGNSRCFDALRAARGTDQQFQQDCTSPSPASCLIKFLAKSGQLVQGFLLFSFAFLAVFHQFGQRHQAVPPGLFEGDLSAA